MSFDDRDRRTIALLHRFGPDGMPEGARPIAQACQDLARSVVERLPDSPELIASLWLLLGARDFLVQATQSEPGASAPSPASPGP